VASMTSLPIADAGEAIDERNWRDRAACRGEDPELFFTNGQPGTTPMAKLIALQIAAAKEVCQSCAARSACLRWALETRQEYGVWGGLSEQERRRLRRSKAVAS
jgi:WhiB family redox-sensing transcriptional regulator